MSVNQSPILASSSSLRALLALPVAIVVTLIIFTVLSKLTSPGDITLNKAYESPDLDFLLVRKESDLEYRNRRRPPPPEEITELEDMTLDQPAMAEALSVDITSSGMDLPNIKVNVQIDMRSALDSMSLANLPTQMFAVDIPFQNNPKAVKDVLPRYPSRAQRKKIDGKLLVEFIVDPNGYVKADSIKFIEANPSGIFENSVIRSLKRSRFEPMMANGQPVSFRAQKPYVFMMPK